MLNYNGRVRGLFLFIRILNGRRYKIFRIDGLNNKYRIAGSCPAESIPVFLYQHLIHDYKENKRYPVFGRVSEQF